MSDQDQTNDAPKLHIDADWKAEAQAEKERLSQKEKTREAEGKAGSHELPEASFATLVDSLAYQALSGLGIFADKASGGVVIDLPGAKFSIDLLQIVEKKTEGNLSDDEKQHLTQVIGELQNRFVQIAKLVQESAAADSGGPAAPAAPGLEMP